jgi:hypothetical protein
LHGGESTEKRKSRREPKEKEKEKEQEKEKEKEKEKEPSPRKLLSRKKSSSRPTFHRESPREAPTPAPVVSTVVIDMGLADTGMEKEKETEEDRGMTRSPSQQSMTGSSGSRPASRSRSPSPAPSPSPSPSPSSSLSLSSASLRHAYHYFYLLSFCPPEGCYLVDIEFQEKKFHNSPVKVIALENPLGRIIGVNTDGKRICVGEVSVCLFELVLLKASEVTGMFRTKKKYRKSLSFFPYSIPGFFLRLFRFFFRFFFFSRDQ